MSDHDQAVRQLLAELHATLAASDAETDAPNLYAQLSRLLVQLSESDRLDPHPPSLGFTADAAAARLLNLACPDRFAQAADDDLKERLSVMDTYPRSRLLDLVRTAALV